MLLGNLVLIWAAASCFLLLPVERPPRFHVCRYVQVSIEVRLLFLISDYLFFVLLFPKMLSSGFPDVNDCSTD